MIWLYDYSQVGAVGLPAAVEVARVGGVLSRRLSAQGRGLVKPHRHPRPEAAGKRNVSVGLLQGVWGRGFVVLAMYLGWESVWSFTLDRSLQQNFCAVLRPRFVSREDMRGTYIALEREYCTCRVGLER